MLKVTSLFSGIGGIDLGLEATGYFKTTLFSEIDPFCQKILKKHWPNVPIIPNVKDINGEKEKMVAMKEMLYKMILEFNYHSQ